MASETNSSPAVRVCAELAVPGLNSTAPLYHQLQQRKQAKGRGRGRGKRSAGRESDRDLGGVNLVQGSVAEEPLPPPVSACRSSSVSTAVVAALSLESTASNSTQVQYIKYTVSY